MVKEHNLLSVFLHISDLYKSELKYSCQIFSNNANSAFSDEEVLTIYLFAMTSERKFIIKQIPQYANDYLRSWFPLLPSYVAFDFIINCLNEAIRLLAHIYKSDSLFIYNKHYRMNTGEAQKIMAVLMS